MRVARIRCFLPKYARSVAKTHNTQYARKLRGGGHVPAGGHVVGLWMFFKKHCFACFAVFYGVLRCFVCVFLAFFTKQQKTDPKVYKTHKTNTKYALCNTIQYSAIRCCASFSRSENVYKKHSQNNVQNIGKHPQNTAKHCSSKKHSQNTTKHPQNTHKTPQNTAKHHKTHLLAKQTELANKPLRSHRAQARLVRLGHRCARRRRDRL